MNPPVQRISSRDNPLLARIRKHLRDPLAYRRLGEVWIEGDHLCEAHAASGQSALHSVISEDAWSTPLKQLAFKAQSVTVIPAVRMTELSALESPPPIGFLIDWSASTDWLPAEPTVVLDRLQDAGNVGTVLRSAAAFGVRQVIAIKGTAGLWSAKVLRAGMGAHFGLRLIESVEASDLQALGIPLLATSSHASKALGSFDLPWPCAWVFGHEGEGVSSALQSLCTQTLRIPQPGGEESLNVASAAAVCLYESARQRLLR
jgi:TrmH family RNA methyltransferase